MEHWHGFGPALNISQVYETTITEGESGLSAHLVVTPARSLGGETYLFRSPGGLLETLGLTRLADVPLGAVARSLAACLVSDDVAEFSRRFDAGFEEEVMAPSVRLPTHFRFAEYLTFARVVPFEWSPVSADSLGNILTSQGKGTAGFARYADTDAPMLFVAIPAGVVICGSTPNVVRALEAGLRRRLLDLVRSRSTEPSGEQPGR